MAEPQRIAKLLARAGVASRREIERMIEEGRVALDGVVLATPATIVSGLQGITVDGEPVAAVEAARLFRYHKPTGLLTAERDARGRTTIYDKLPPGLPRVVPVGRLDLTTEGLLLMTTDGELKRRLELPSTGVPRSYRARAYGPVTQAQLEDLIDGIEIDGVRYGRIDANLERRTGTNVWIELTLSEGKNREVRRVLEHLGLRVSRLIRTRYGPFVLGDLAAGAVEEVKQHELVEFLKTLDSAPVAAARDPALAGQTMRKHWRIALPKGVPLPRPAGPGRPDPVRSAPARAVPAKIRTAPPAPTEAPAPRPKRAKVDRTGWAKPKPKPGRGPRSG